MLSPIILQTKLTYKWPNEYANNVSFEYDRFMKLRSINENLSPSDDIDKFWHQHILNTKHYNNYCLVKFNKFVHHDPIDSVDQYARQKRLSDTINTYTSTFGPIIHNQIWGLQLKPENKSKNKNAHLIPNLNNTNVPKIKVEIMYTFDVYDKDGNFITKKWIPNDKTYDKKIIPISFDSKPFKIIDLKNLLSKKTGHFKYAIKIYSHTPNKPFDYLYIKTNNYLQDEKLISDLIHNGNSYFMGIFDEVTSNGFC